MTSIRVDDPQQYNLVHDDLSLLSDDSQSERQRDGAEVCLRRPYINLNTTMEELNKKYPTVTSHYLYADEIDCGPDAIALPADSILRIFARVGFYSAVNTPLSFACAGNADVSLFIGNFNPHFELQFQNITGGSHLFKPIKGMSVGIHFAVRQDAPTFKSREITHYSQNELMSPNYLEEASHPIAIIGNIWRNDNLPALLRYQFMLASSWFYRHHELTTSLLDHVIRSTSRSVILLPLFLEAEALRSRLQTKYAGVTYLTPSADLNSTRKIVIEALKSVTAFERAFRTFAAEERDDKSNIIAAKQLVEQSRNMESHQGDLNTVAEEQTRKAENNRDAATVRFKKQQDENKHLNDRLNTGLHLWQKHNTHQEHITRFFEILSLVGTVVGDVVRTCLDPQTAPANILDLGKTIVTFQEDVRGNALREKIKLLYENVAKLGAKYTNLQNKCKELREEADAMLKVNMQELDADERAKMAWIQDPGELKTLWNDFGLTIKPCLQLLIDEGIGGAAEYMEGLRKLIDRGTGIVDADLKLAEAATLLYKQQLRLVFTQAETVRLGGYVKDIQKSGELPRAFKHLVTDRLLEMRNLVYLDFQSYISAYSYYSLESSPVTISSTKASPNYQADIAVLQRAITRVSDASRSQVMKEIILSTDDKTLFDDNWKNRLITDRVISFTIPTDNIEFLYCTRVRITLIRFWIDGLECGQDVDMNITVGPELLDKVGYSRDPILFVTTNPVKIRFRYTSGENHPIRVDGCYAYPELHLKPTPFTEWKIELSNDKLDLTGASRLRLELECEVSGGGP